MNVLTVIHSFNNHEHLRRCLQSVRAHSQLRSGSVLVVDDSSNQEILDQNDKLIFAQNDPDLTIISSKHWADVESRFHFLNEDARKYIKTLRPGAPGWNIGRARNLAHLCFLKLFPQAKLMFSLDADMVVLPHFSYEERGNSRLVSPGITGCPDLCRLEWLSLLASFWEYHSGRERTKSSSDYVDALLNASTYSFVNYLVCCYTDLLERIDASPDFSGTLFPQREELYGGCFIIERTNDMPLVPPWYDNDWFFFREARVSNDQVRFTTDSICHESSFKPVLAIEPFKSEELGKAALFLRKEICEGSLSSTDIDLRIRSSLEAINYETRRFESLRAALPDYVLQIDKILSVLATVSEYLIQEAGSSIADAAQSYSEELGIWRSVVSC